jgi:DNA-binding CsgD family transcriptional regulator
MVSRARSRESGTALTRKTWALWLLLALQGFCALFFLVDVVLDLSGFEDALGGVEHHSFELIVVVALGLGVVLTSMEIRKVLRRHKRMAGQLRAASGAFWELMEEHFDGWALTPSERDVAMLAIKGLSIAEIAQIRNTKVGTIKAQSNAIYAKAGVTGRPQLLSLFIDELMSEALIANNQSLGESEQS